jgi:AraC family transcriptional regulator
LQNIFLVHYDHPGCELPEHTNPYHVLEVMGRSSSHHDRRLGDRTLSAPVVSDEIFFCPTGVDHRIRWEDTQDFTLLCFDPNLLESEFGCNPADVVPLWRMINPHTLSLAHAIKQDLEQGCPWGTFYSDAHAIALMAHLLKRMKTVKEQAIDQFNGLSQRRLNAVQKLIHWKIAESEAPTLPEMAKEAGMSQHHFSRLFKQSVGISPGKYVNQLRIERAKMLLRTSERTIAQVALDCGFNPRNFNNIFKQFVGVTPTKFRQGL